MREILFRGKRVDNDEWVYGHYVVFNKTDHRIVINKIKKSKHWSDVFDNFIEVHPASVGMWTGLKDKNKVDVYEGDIVDLPTFVHLNQSSHEGYMDFDMHEPRHQKGMVVYNAPSFDVKGDFWVSCTDSPTRKEKEVIKPLAIRSEWELGMHFEEWCGGYGLDDFKGKKEEEDICEWVDSDRHKESKPWLDFLEWNQIEVIGNTTDTPELLDLRS